MEPSRPRVTLRSFSREPYASAIAAARSCYAPRVIEPSEVTAAQRDSVGPLTYGAGHHTVYQHAHFEFGLENVSRHFVWSFLHSHPFYNSEQSSQRYVKQKQVAAFAPPLEGDVAGIYETAIAASWDSYFRLIEILRPVAREKLCALYHVRPTSLASRSQRMDRFSEKRAMEIARYVLPIAAFTSMVHTISGITLFRLVRLRNSGDTPMETAMVIDEMVRCVREIDPDFFAKVGDAPVARDDLPETPFTAARPASTEQRRRIDAELAGRSSRLVSCDPGAPHLLADAGRLVLGENGLSDDRILELMLNPALNIYRRETLDLGFHSPLLRPLHHVQYTFLKKISHTADSQDQRHRMVPASRPMLLANDSADPDFITPMLIDECDAARHEYTKAMRSAWDAKAKLLEAGLPLELAQYVLPNALALRFYESGSLMYLLHKWTLRTCLNAQEEIFRASMEELEQVRAVHPAIARYIGPFCVLRNGITSPRCPEGDHFCGVPVWRDFPNIRRTI
ncbi:MAG: FAD-dependent thymidylate synthase [Acidobacteria bacterium]|nr:FAD-dependent thymidylate synthase [Acidobacteriota bacterium]